jgi:hypothetical protein
VQLPSSADFGLLALGVGFFGRGELRRQRRAARVWKLVRWIVAGVSSLALFAAGRLGEGGGGEQGSRAQVTVVRFKRG